METAQRTTTSRDGTTIAYEQSGTGPALVLVAAALSDRSGTAKLARLLAPKFTVFNYDRRGRGLSSDTPPYAIEREVEDLEALAEAAGGSVCLFGSSSGAVLALDAANRLGARARGVFLYEPPLIVDDSRPPMPADIAARIDTLVDEGRRGHALRCFFHEGMGIPAVFVFLMRLLMPGWSKMAAMAHTIWHDLTILDGLQAGQPLPAGRWASVVAPTLVVVGGRSEAFFHSGAQALAGVLPGARYRRLEGRDHSAVVMAPKALAAEMERFFLLS